MGRIRVRVRAVRDSFRSRTVSSSVVTAGHALFFVMTDSYRTAQSHHTATSSI